MGVDTQGLLVTRLVLLAIICNIIYVKFVSAKLINDAIHSICKVLRNKRGRVFRKL